MSETSSHVWIPDTTHNMTCGSYSIARNIVPVDSKRNKKVYVLWRGKERLDQFDTFPEAKEHHAKLEKSA